jgi:anaerobic magnesium-protoporphyrin IX monomethyl ester cyclase
MKYALVNPDWDFAGSTYFGCREPHLPLELLFARDQLRHSGHEALLLDAQMGRLTVTEVRQVLRQFDPDFLVLPTAPSYLFWRCPQPELRIPQLWLRELGGRATKVLIGPHPSATPAATLRKTGADVVIRGEPDCVLSDLPLRAWQEIPGCCWREGESLHISPELAAVDMNRLGALDFRDYPVELHSHRHHVFHGEGRGAELEFARGCPWACTFCNKTLFRDKFRERNVGAVLEEVDALIARGVDYIYFIDEIFGVGRNVRRLLEAIAERNISIGLQTRIDLWNEETLDLLGRAHCISMECGVESITQSGREELNKNCRLSTDRIAELLICARARIPWVQANLILTPHDDRAGIRSFQQQLRDRGVWVGEPVPMFPFPGSPLYQQTFGAPPDDLAWERAHQHYTSQFSDGDYSDIQEQKPVLLEALEGGVHTRLAESA